MKYRNVVILSLFHPVKAQDSHVYWAYHFSVTAMRTAQFDGTHSYVAPYWCCMIHSSAISKALMVMCTG